MVCGQMELVLSRCQASQEGSQTVSGVADWCTYSMCAVVHHTLSELWLLWSTPEQGLTSLVHTWVHVCSYTCSNAYISRYI